MPLPPLGEALYMHHYVYAHVHICAIKNFMQVSEKLAFKLLNVSHIIIDGS